jgi:hypothetical protein
VEKTRRRAIGYVEPAPQIGGFDNDPVDFLFE